MSLHPASDSSVPDDTAAVARAVFPQGTACLRLRDRLGPIFADEQFVSLFPKSGQPAECPWRLALVTLLQFDLDWDRQIATCPAGQTSESWIPDTNGGHDNVRIRFSLT